MQKASLSDFLWMVLTDNSTGEIRYEYLTIPANCAVNLVTTFNIGSMKFERFTRKYWRFLSFFGYRLFLTQLNFWVYRFNFHSTLSASDPDWERYYLDGINQRKTDLAKIFKPRGRGGRKPVVKISEDPPDVGCELEVLAVEHDFVTNKAGSSRPTRAASTLHVGKGNYAFFNFIQFFVN